jgi:hypothetical protein
MRVPADRPESRIDPSMLETMRAWRAAHPHATFAEIEVEATRQVAALRRELIAAALAAEEPAAAPNCPACGRAMVRNGTGQRTITTSQAERVPITGPRYRCPACGAERFPPR